MKSRIQLAGLALVFSSLLPGCALLYEREDMRMGALLSWMDYGSWNTDLTVVGAGNDLGGSEITDGDVWLEYGAKRDDRSADRGIGVRMSFDLATDPSNEQLEDAYVTAPASFNSDITLAAGRFKPNIFRSGSSDPEEGVFPDRPLIGQGFDWWDEGIWAEYNIDNFYAGISITNGEMKDINRYLYVARGEVKLGDDESPGHGFVGATFFDDDSIMGQDGRFYGLDFSGRFGRFQVDGEIGEYEDGVPGVHLWSRDSIYNAAGLNLSPNTSPWDITLSADLAKRWSVGLRYENLGNMTEDQVVGVAGRYSPHESVHWYISANQISSDLDARDGTLLTWGFSWGQSGSN